jgi:2,3-diketo-5-methylthio-1-phosphopentane phosphatase
LAAKEAVFEVPIKLGASSQSTGFSSVSRARVKCRVFVDFDGTIAPVDTTDLLLERFADPAWRDIEDDWKAGRIGSRECMVRQIDLVRATPAQMDAFVAAIDIDPGFRKFVNFCACLGHDVTVVSDGLDWTVGAVLKRHELELPFYANHLEWHGDDRWRLTFPNARSDCRALSGTCKCHIAQASALELSIIVGDGRSDFCVAGRVDVVLAKAALLDHSLETGLPHLGFANFDEATEVLATWLERRHPNGAQEPAQRAD